MHYVDALITFLLIFFPAMAGERADSDLILCSGDEDCHIIYDHLSSQSADPFKISGVVVDVGHLRFKEFRRALAKFPNVRACLMKKERDSKTPDLRNFAWSKMTRDAYIEVCLFRIMSSLNDPDLAAQWYRSQGLTGGPPRSVKSRGKNMTITSTANYPRDTGKSYLAVIWPLNYLQTKLLYVEYLHSAWTDDGNLFLVYYSATSK